MFFNIIVAYDNQNGIGYKNKLSWYIKSDLNRFKTITTGHIVIMGKNTWESLSIKPLPNRINIVISSTLNDDRPNKICKTLNEALNCEIVKNNESKDIFVIGGEKLYTEAICHKDCEKIYVTEVYKKYNCDTFFPKIPKDFNVIFVDNFCYENEIHYRYITYAKNGDKWINKEEETYTNLLYNIIDNGDKRIDRTKVGTNSLFGKTLTYDLRETFPILTTRRQFLRGIFEELMFYLRGETDNNILVNKGINVWTKNTTREFLDNRGLDYKEGDMGPTYGFNFRNFGANYLNCDTDYKDQGVDQLFDVIELLKTDPYSRRMIITLWDPKNNKKAALPSCLCWYQFHVSGSDSNYLNLQIYIRSSDYFLANNWNTCTGALLVHLLCNTTGLTHYKPGELNVVMGDVHVYNNHVKSALEIKSRIPKPFPKLVIKNQLNYVTEFSWDDIELIGYKPHPSVKVEMAV